MSGERESWTMVGNERMTMSKQRVDLELTHLHYIQSEECPAKIELRNRLQELSEEWVSVQPHHKKFALDELPSILASSVLQHPSEDVAFHEVANAFLALARYTNNIISQPWRTEFRTIKLYGGYYQQEIGCILPEVDRLMVHMGYELDSERHLWIFRLPRKQQREDLPKVALDLFLAAIECQMMSRIWTAVTAREPQLSLYNVLQYREQHVSSWEVAVRGLLYEARAHSYALSQTALTPMTPVATVAPLPAMPVMPPLTAPLSYGYCMYHPINQPYYPSQPQQSHVQSNQYSLLDNNPHNLDVPPPPPPPTQYIPEQSYAAPPMPQYSKSSYASSGFMPNPQYGVYPDQNYYQPAQPLYQPSYVYPNPTLPTEYQVPTNAGTAAIPPHLLYDQNAVLIDFSAPQPRYEAINLDKDTPTPSSSTARHNMQGSRHQDNRNNYPVQNGREEHRDPLPLKPKQNSRQSHGDSHGDTVKSRARPKHMKHSPPPLLKHSQHCQQPLSPSQVLSDDDDHSWEYVFRNLEIQGYNKDLGERGDLLKPIPARKATSPTRSYKLPNFNDKDHNIKSAKDKEVDKEKLQADEAYPRKQNVLRESSLNLTKQPSKKNQVNNLDSPPSPRSNKTKTKNGEVKENGSKDIPDSLKSNPVATTTSSADASLLDAADTVDEKWHCHACTYLNDAHKTVCTICGKSKLPGPEARAHHPGPQCPQCTLVNPVGRDYCDACGACLRPTYI